MIGMQRQVRHAQQAGSPEIGPDVHPFGPHLGQHRRRVRSQAGQELGQRQRPRIPGSGQVVIGLQPVPRSQVAMDRGDPQHREDPQSGHDRAADPLPAHGDRQAEAQAEYVRPGDISAGHQQRDPQPRTAPAVGQIPGEQGDEENGQAFCVEVERH